jgi:hypothetical protein
MSLVTSSFYGLVASTVIALLLPCIVTVESLSQISTTQPHQTLFLFDIDDTIFDSPSMLSSRGWRKYIAEATKKIDTSENWHDIFSFALARKYPLKPVENITSQFVKELQDKGYVVCGFTSRERNLWYDMPHYGVDALTVEQLHSVDINFSDEGLKNAYPFLSMDPEYFGGIFFANIEPKGKFLLHLFAHAPNFPEKVIFIDDKRSQVESVANALAELGIQHECYLYSAVDEKEKAFDPLVANIQLYCFYRSNGKEFVSDQEAALIAKKHPEKDAEYYLRATLDIAKNMNLKL